MTSAIRPSSARLRNAFGRTLKVPTLAERLAPYGGAVIASNVSPGAAYFQDPDHFGHVVHRAGSFGPGGEVLGLDQAPVVSHDYAGDEALADWFCDEVLMKRKPRLAVLWLANPDSAMHADKLGSQTHLDGIACADRCLRPRRGHCRRAPARRGRGHPAARRLRPWPGNRHRPASPLRTSSIEAGLKDGPDSTDVVVAPQGGSGLIYLADARPDRAPAILSFLRAQPWAAEVFYGDEMLHLGQRPGDGLAIVVAMARNEEPNEFGVPRPDHALRRRSEARQAGRFRQPWRARRLRAPPVPRRQWRRLCPGHRRSTASRRLIDIAPTILRFLDLPRSGMDGLALPQN